LFTYCQTKFHFIWYSLVKYCRLVLAGKLQTPVISLKGMGHEMKIPFEGHKSNQYFLYMRRWFFICPLPIAEEKRNVMIY
jgi:hypothetical protein